jgi:SAM-dependent methyltransferase
MHTNSALLFQKYAAPYFLENKRVLEIGPNFPSHYKILSKNVATWDTLDIYQDPRLTHVAMSEYSFPTADNSYDIVLSGQVIEHVRKIWVWMKEVARVCKIGGNVITIIPASWPYHEAPIDCWRAYPEGMKALYEDASLRTIHSSCEALEIDASKKLPGRSAEWQGRRSRLANKLFSKIGLPVECAFDTITIGEKIVS